MTALNWSSLGTYGYSATFNDEGAVAGAVGAVASGLGASMPRAGDEQDAPLREMTPRQATMKCDLGIAVVVTELLFFMHILPCIA
jgi:hypothetical protein